MELVQVAILVPVAYALGWSPRANAGAVLGGVVLATVAFAGVGMLLAGALPALTTLAAANGLYLLLLLLGGMVVPLAKLPGGLRVAAEALTAAALSTILHHGLSGGGADAGPWLVLAAWAVAAPVAAAVTFRWE